MRNCSLDLLKNTQFCYECVKKYVMKCMEVFGVTAILDGENIFFVFRSSAQLE